MSDPGDALDFRAMFRSSATPCLVLDTSLLVCEVSTAFLKETGRTRESYVGHQLLDAFPRDPEDPTTSHGSLEVEESLRRALAQREPDRMPLLKYSVETEPGSGQFEVRWWSTVNIPVLDDDGVVTMLIHTIEDVTDVMTERERGSRHRIRGDEALERAQSLEADLFARAREIQVLTAAEAVAARRLQGLASVALDLAGAETVEELTDIVVQRGVGALGCDSGGVAVRDEDEQVVRLVITDTIRDDQRIFKELPLTARLPSTVAAATGQAVLLGNRAAGLAWAPEMAEVYATAGREAWASLPLQVGGRLLGSLTLSWDEPRDFSGDEAELLAAFAAQCAQALERVLIREAEQLAVLSTRQMSEALQRSLLTEPPKTENLQLAVRYLPAAEEAYVGGDWYDAFVVPDGNTLLVIGDVAGHDRVATTAMAQVRNVLRGVAQTSPAPPAHLLSALDHAMQRLPVDALATAVLAKIEQTADQAERGLRVLHWSNAGHPPPLLIHPDGRTQLLRREEELLLGVDHTTTRSDHEQVLHPDDTILLYTDGLVERRGESLTEGLEWLRETVGALAGLPLEDLCDALLASLPEMVEDDVALLAIRTQPVDGSRDGARALAAQPISWPESADDLVAELVLAHDLAAVRRARAFVQHHCRAGRLGEEACDTSVLLTSEIVTNAFIHGRSEARLRVLIRPGTVRIEVGDDNARHPQRAERNDQALDGRGLDVLDLLSARWGVQDHPAGKIVWFEVADAG